MRVRCFLVMLLVCSCGFVRVAAQSQDLPNDNARKVIRRIVPAYPPLAKKMNLKGTVKVFALVAPDGAVKKVEPIGGNPVLLEAAQDAVAKWKFVPAGAESKELVELHFDPDGN